MKVLAIPLCATALFFSCNEKGRTAEPTIQATSSTPAVTVPIVDTVPKVDSATMMKNWQAYMTPGEPHKLMASWDGTWAGDITMWMDPNASPSKSTGIAVNKMVLGGRYQQSVHKGSFDGMPFEGMSTLAYDNARKVYISTWIDNMGTGMMVLEGPWDPASKSITFTGKMVDPATNRQVSVREVFKPIDNNYQVMEMYMQGPDGKEFKTMEIKFTRKN